MRMWEPKKPRRLHPPGADASLIRRALRGALCMNHVFMYVPSSRILSLALNVLRIREGSGHDALYTNVRAIKGTSLLIESEAGGKSIERGELLDLDRLHS